MAVLTALSLTCFLGLAASSPAAAEPCPNEALRSGLSAQLPDCRAYELVTPADANGRRLNGIRTLFGHDLFLIEPVSTLRDSFLFSTIGAALRSPPGGNSTDEGNVYAAERGASGWQVVRHLTPSGAEAVDAAAGGVSSDHEYLFAFVKKGKSGDFGSLAREGSAVYLGDPGGAFELAGTGSIGTDRLAQGRFISAGGEHVIFSTGHLTSGSAHCFQEGPAKCLATQLEPEAPPTGTGAVYDREADGPTKVVSLLPGDVTPAAGEDAAYQGVSTGGSAVAFVIGGTLYVRVDNLKTKEVASGEPTYGGFSAEGDYLFYVSGGDIHRLGMTSEEDEEINSSGDALMVNVSTDGSHVYFISPSQLDGSEGTAGQPNMYLWNGGPPQYIATVVPSDLEETSSPAVDLANWTERAVVPNGPTVSGGPGHEASRTTPDGSVIVFESRAQLTAYPNAGHSEIYRYDEDDESLQCVSCNSSMAPASVDAQLQDLGVLAPTNLLHNLSVDGRRVFFETEEALVADDIDGINDIYEWQQPPEGSPTLDLISSGSSETYPQLVPSPGKPNVLSAVTPDGSDVFFVSQDALVAGAGMGGASAIYDARIGGSFPVPAPKPPACLEWSTCQGPGSEPPSLQGAGSQTLAGAGNVKPRKHHCVRHMHRTGTRKGRFCHRHKPGGGRLR